MIKKFIIVIPARYNSSRPWQATYQNFRYSNVDKNISTMS